MKIKEKCEARLTNLVEYNKLIHITYMKEEKYMKCPDCGEEIGETKKCDKCGTTIKQTQEKENGFEPFRENVSTKKVNKLDRKSVV